MNNAGPTDWLDDILKTEAPVPVDPVFVAQVLHRLDMPQPVTYARPQDELLGWLRGETLMVVSAITLLVTFTPAMAQGWLAFSLDPWNATGWLQAGFIAACLSVAALVHIALNMAQWHPMDAMN